MSSKHLLVAAVAWICFVLLSLPQSIYGASSRQGHHKVTIQNVIVVEEDKIKLVGEGDFKGKTIRLVSQTGETLLAAYNPAEKMFITPTGKRAVPGVGYDVKADWAQIPKKQAHFVIPNLLFAKQVTSNRIELLYDRPVNLKTATKANSYWVRKNADRPADIASLGRNDPVTLASALTSDQVVIAPIDNTGSRFLMTFTVSAIPGVQYTVIPCFITTPDKSEYEGSNFSPSSQTTFTAQAMKQ